MGGGQAFKASLLPFPSFLPPFHSQGNLVPIATATVIYPLLLSAGAYPSFSGVNILTTVNCPVGVCTCCACARPSTSFFWGGKNPTLCCGQSLPQAGLSPPRAFCCLSADTSLQAVGSYSCVVSSSNVVINNLPYCSLFLSIVGALTMSSNQITFQISKVCLFPSAVLFASSFALAVEGK